MVRQAEDACRACHNCTCLGRFWKLDDAALPDRGSVSKAPEPPLPHDRSSYLGALSDTTLSDYDRAFSIRELRVPHDGSKNTVTRHSQALADASPVNSLCCAFFMHAWASRMTSLLLIVAELFDPETHVFCTIGRTAFVTSCFTLTCKRTSAIGRMHLLLTLGMVSTRHPSKRSTILTPTPQRASCDARAPCKNHESTYHVGCESSGKPVFRRSFIRAFIMHAWKHGGTPSSLRNVAITLLSWPAFSARPCRWHSSRDIQAEIVQRSHPSTSTSSDLAPSRSQLNCLNFTTAPSARLITGASHVMLKTSSQGVHKGYSPGRSDFYPAACLGTSISITRSYRNRTPETQNPRFPRNQCSWRVMLQSLRQNFQLTHPPLIVLRWTEMWRLYDICLFLHNRAYITTSWCGQQRNAARCEPIYGLDLPLTASFHCRSMTPSTTLLSSVFPHSRTRT